MARRHYIRAMGGVLAIAAVSCIRGDPSVECPDVRDRVRCLLVADIRASSSYYEDRFSEGNVVVRGWASDAVPDLWYYIASYAPPQTYDVFFFAAAVRRGEKANLLHGVADWLEAVGEWRPSSPDEALGACTEAAMADSDPASPIRAVVYVQGKTADDLLDRNVYSESPGQFAQLMGPATRDAGGHYQINFWIIEFEHASQIRCIAQKQGPMLLAFDRVAQLDSIFLISLGP